MGKKIPVCVTTKVLAAFICKSLELKKRVMKSFHCTEYAAIDIFGNST